MTILEETTTPEKPNEKNKSSPLKKSHSTPKSSPQQKPAPITRYVLAYVDPKNRGIDRKDVLNFLFELQKINTPKETTVIDFLLNSNGGDIYSAYKIICLIRSKCSKLRIIVPLYAKSAATLIALGADQIVMAPQSELGPLDAPMEHPIVEGISLSALDGIRPLEFLSNFAGELAVDSLGARVRRKVGLGRKDSVEMALCFAGKFVEPIVGKLDPLVINMCFRRLQIAERYGHELLMEYMFKEKPSKDTLATNTIRELVWEYPEHGYAICSAEAKRIHLEIQEENDAVEEWNKFWNLFLMLNEEKEKVIRLVPQEIFEPIPDIIMRSNSVESQETL